METNHVRSAFTFLVGYLLACGFQLQKTPPAILSKIENGEEFLVLTEEKENREHLIAARRLLTLKATKDLHMSADELPKYKVPQKLTNAGDHAAGRAPSASEFDPYKGHRYDAKSAATGKTLGPDGNYVSPTEKKLADLQSHQSRLEKKFHKPLEDRQLVATMPNSGPPRPIIETEGPSDGKLLAGQFMRREQERKQREEGGFTTKAMRDLQAMKNKKVYSHSQIRIQFPDACALEAKFLPKEKVETIMEVVKSAFMTTDFQFELYVAPPRRKLDVSNTLEEEGLVPAAKVFLSWKDGPAKGTPVGSFLKPELFQEGANKPSYPSAKAVDVAKNDNSKPAAKKSKPAPKEDDMLRRMMGGKGGLGGAKSKSGGGKGGGKPKWFKG